MKRTIVAAIAGSVLVLTLASCGTQTDERVEPAESAAVEESPDAAASLEAAGAGFVTIDCVSGQAMTNDTAPQGTTIGAVTASLQPTGAPSITVQVPAEPATELATAEIVEGTGAEAQPGDTLTVDYCGVGLGSATMFDSSWSRGEPATFPLDGVIPGWQEGVPGMKVGGTRLLVIPGELGYGEQGTAGIAPNETLIFVVQLQSIG